MYTHICVAPQPLWLRIGLDEAGLNKASPSAPGADPILFRRFVCICTVRYTSV